MKIWGQVPQVFGVYDKNKTVSKVNSTTGTTGKKDQISLSEQAKDYQVALKAVRDSADIRPDKVDELKSKVETDTYEVSGDNVASKILDSILGKKE